MKEKRPCTHVQNRRQKKSNQCQELMKINGKYKQLKAIIVLMVYMGRHNGTYDTPTHTYA